MHRIEFHAPWIALTGLYFLVRYSNETKKLYSRIDLNSKTYLPNLFFRGAKFSYLHSFLVEQIWSLLCILLFLKKEPKLLYRCQLRLIISFMHSSKNSAMPCPAQNLSKKKPGLNTKPSILTLSGI